MEIKQYQLPEDFAEKWLTALRSGNYKQTTDKYKWHGMSCAMGVGYTVNGFKIKSGKYTDNRPTPMQIGLQREIMELNDNKQRTFTEIADWIESNVEFV